jgi:hypothetical protein
MMLALFACSQPIERVTMSGVVGDAPKDAGDPVEGVDVGILDGNLLEFDSVTTAADGSFAVDVPAGTIFYVQVTGEGWLGTAFSGTAGIVDFDAGDGYPWVAAPEFVDTLRTTFADCDSATAEGAVVAGEVRYYEAVDDVNSLPLVEVAQVVATGSDAEYYEACYIADADATEEPTQTGDAGSFAVFGLPEGPLLLEIHTPDEVGSRSVVYQFAVPEGGLVPLYPALFDAG